MLVGGNFNIIHCQEEEEINARRHLISNAIIESLDLRGIVLWGLQFTLLIGERCPLTKISTEC
jgi:hypothetical protein